MGKGNKKSRERLTLTACLSFRSFSADSLIAFDRHGNTPSVIGQVPIIHVIVDRKLTEGNVHKFCLVRIFFYRLPKELSLLEYPRLIYIIRKDESCQDA